MGKSNIVGIKSADFEIISRKYKTISKYTYMYFIHYSIFLYRYLDLTKETIQQMQLSTENTMSKYHDVLEPTVRYVYRWLELNKVDAQLTGYLGKIGCVGKLDTWPNWLHAQLLCDEHDGAHQL